VPGVRCRVQGVPFRPAIGPQVLDSKPGLVCEHGWGLGCRVMAFGLGCRVMAFGVQGQGVGVATQRQKQRLRVEGLGLGLGLQPGGTRTGWRWRRGTTRTCVCVCVCVCDMRVPCGIAVCALGSRNTVQAIRAPLRFGA
jgi:hypothetical protein